MVPLSLIMNLLIYMYFFIKVGIMDKPLIAAVGINRSNNTDAV